MEDSELDYAPPGGFAVSAAGLALGIGCLAALPRPGIDLIFSEINDQACIFEERGFELTPPGGEEVVEPTFVERMRATGGLAPGMLTLDAEDRIDASDLGVLRNIDFLVRNQTLPLSWSRENVEEPTSDCTEYTRIVLRRLFINYGLVPYKVTALKDGGILAVYQEAFSKNILRVEVDNELDAIAVVTDGNTILSSGLLEQDDEEAWVLDSFLGIFA